MKKYTSELVAVILFIILLPIYSLVNFYQNDDWVYYKNLNLFQNHRYILDPITAPTFYSIGIISLLWLKIFGITQIPILTLLISVLNFYFFFKILELENKFSKMTNILISLILFFNVFHAYSSVGFMTENYVLCFFLLAILFFSKFQKTRNYKNLWISNLFSFIGFYAKQNTLVFPVGLALYFLINKNWREFKIQLISIFGILVSYYVFFPKTPEMIDKGFDFANITNFNYSFSLIYSILIYLVFFSLPFVFKIFTKQLDFFKIKNILCVFILSISLYFCFEYLFKPGEISWEEFPYLENTFERTGFLPRTINGTKYQFKYNFDLYFYIDLISKISIVFLIAFIIMKNERFKLLNNPYFISLIVGLGLMIFVEVFFDRYILLLLPLIYLFLINLIDNDSFIFKLSLAIYLLFVGYFSYFLTLDFILSHNYIWSKSQDLVKSEFVEPSEINSSGAWKKTYDSFSSKYFFTYDSFTKNENLKDYYELVEQKEITFVGNLFIDSKIYLYKLKNF